MQILELQIKNFGKFSNTTISFHEGMNIIYGENEMGKTTIHSFIRGMLFGIDKMRGRASKKDEYSLRLPWDNPGYYAGVMRFASGGKVFRIERTFSKNEKKAILVCETDGEELDILHGDLQMLMEGMSEEAFRNTVYIGQKSSETDEGLASELRNYMANFEHSADDEINVSRAVDLLKGKQREYEGKKKQQDVARAGRLSQIQMKLDYVEQEIRTLHKQYEDGSVQLMRLKALEKQEKAEKERQQKEYSKVQNTKIVEKEVYTRTPIPYSWQQLLMTATIIIAIIIGFAAKPVWCKLIAGGAAVLLAAGLVYYNRVNHNRNLKNGHAPATHEKAEFDLLNEPKSQAGRKEDAPPPSYKLAWSLEHLQEEIHEKQVIYDNLKETWMDIREEAGVEDKLGLELEALNLALTTIQSLSDEIYKESAMRLNRTASAILSEITDGGYTSIFLDEKMQLRINTPQKLLYIEQVSRGTMDQIYFALRMTVAQMLCEGERMPVILDDAFAMYDEKRLERTLCWLKNSGHQVLLFTCHKREGDILDRIQEL